MYLTGAEDGAGGPERLGCEAAYIQICVVGGKRLENSPPKRLYRHPNSGSSSDTTTEWSASASDDSRGGRHVYRNRDPRWDFVGGTPRPTEFYAEPSFMRAPDPTAFPAPKFGPRKAAQVVPATVPVEAAPDTTKPAIVELVATAPPRTLASRPAATAPPIEVKALTVISPLVSRNPLGSGIRPRLKLLPRSKPLPVAAPVIINTVSRARAPFTPVPTVV